MQQGAAVNLLDLRVLAVAVSVTGHPRPVPECTQPVCYWAHDSSNGDADAREVGTEELLGTPLAEPSSGIVRNTIVFSCDGNSKLDGEHLSNELGKGNRNRSSCFVLVHQRHA